MFSGRYGLLLNMYNQAGIGSVWQAITYLWSGKRSTVSYIFKKGFICVSALVIIMLLARYIYIVVYLNISC